MSLYQKLQSANEFLNSGWFSIFISILVSYFFYKYSYIYNGSWLSEKDDMIFEEYINGFKCKKYRKRNLYNNEWENVSVNEFNKLKDGLIKRSI